MGFQVFVPAVDVRPIKCSRALAVECCCIGRKDHTSCGGQKVHAA